MRRVLLDTNVYGLIVIDKDRTKITEKLSEPKDVRIYGNSVIRKELRSTSKGIIDGINLRNDLLRLFDGIARNNYEITPQIRKIAEDYFIIYKKLGGKMSWKEIINDFLIVSCASLHNLDIVVSEDRRTMLSDFALKSYDIANSIAKRKTPKFIRYEKLKEMVGIK